MNKTEMINAILEAPSACKELKAAAQAYLDAVGTDGEKAAAKALVAECEEDITGIDDVIEFFLSDMAKKIFGEDIAAQKLEHMKEIKAEGAAFCDCPGCSAAKAVIDNKEMFYNF